MTSRGGSAARFTRPSPEGFVYPDSRCCSVVFMDQPAKSIDADDCAVTLIPGDSRLRRLEREATVRSFCVVVAQVLSEDPEGYVFSDSPSEQRRCSIASCSSSVELVEIVPRIRRRDLLGGLIHEYYSVAA